jgi:rhodanese-related sulfurtransferase
MTCFICIIKISPYINKEVGMSISVKAAIKLIAQNAGNPKFKLIDVRTAPERAASSIPNSHHIPVADLERSIDKFSK